MQNDKDLFDLIKETYPLNPREEFVSSTSHKLKQTARKLTIKRRLEQFSVASICIAMCALALSWFIFDGGKEVILSNLNTHHERNSASSPAVSSKDPLVYIYQTHNLESFFSESKTNDPEKAYNDTKNITLVGERLSQSLKKSGIESIHDETNITQILKQKNLSYSESYKVSREPLKETIEKNKSIKMVFDLHRDTQKRSLTTTKINGKDYAKIYFIVSGSSRNYSENFRFATLLNNKIQKAYPNNLSKGVLVKNKPSNQSTYNQDLIDNSVMIEIGGVENTLQEEYRTADVLADIIKETLSEITKQDIKD